MFKLLLKHFIYEQCINVLFDNISNAFFVPQIRYFTLKKGDMYDSITVDGVVYNNCTINDVKGMVLVYVYMKDRDDAGIPSIAARVTTLDKVNKLGTKIVIERTHTSAPGTL